MAELEVGHVIVPLDGSPFAERALPVAAWLGPTLGADVDVIAVADSAEEEEQLTGYTSGLAARAGVPIASITVARGDDPADRVAALELEREPAVVCMASHGRGRSAALLGSVARRVLTVGGQPVVLVGPEAGLGPADGPVVACVDGTPEGEELIPTAADWARALGRRLVVVTVAEPVPAPMRVGEPYRRRHGPATDADRYMHDLVLQTRGHQPGLDVSGRALYDPISPAEGLRGWLATAPAGLLVMAARSRHRLAQAVVGSTTAALVRHSRVPVLAMRYA